MRHLWTIVCLTAVLDKYTNRISLLEVIDEITISEGEEVALPLHLEVASQWERSRFDTPEDGFCRVQVFTPAGELSGGGELPVDLSAAPRSRTILRFEAFPLAGLGKYCFRVSQRHSGQKEWKAVGEVPLYVKREEEVLGSESPPDPPRRSRVSKKKV